MITNELAPVLYAILVRDHLKILNWESKPTADSAAPPHDWRGAEEFSGLADGAVHPRRSLGGGISAPHVTRRSAPVTFVRS